MKDYKRTQIKLSNRYEIFNCIKTPKQEKEDSLTNYIHLSPLSPKDIYKFISPNKNIIIYNS